MGPWPDPIGLGVGFVSGSKGVWVPSCPDPIGFRFGSFRVQTQYGLGWRVGLDPRGFEFGSFPVRTPNWLGWGRCQDLKGLRDGCIFGPKRV
jgi:hypothetical protein